MIYAVLTVDVAWHFSVPFGIKNDRLIIQWRKKYWQLVASVSILFFAVLCEYVVGCISVLYTPICYTHVRCKVCKGVQRSTASDTAYASDTSEFK